MNRRAHRRFIHRRVSCGGGNFFISLKTTRLVVVIVVVVAVVVDVVVGVAILVIVVSPLVGEARSTPNRGGKKEKKSSIPLDPSDASLSLSFSISLYLSSVSLFRLPFALHSQSCFNPVESSNVVVKRTTRSFALLSSFAGIKSVSLCRRGSPSSLFSFSRAYSARFWQEVAAEEPERKSEPGRPLSFSGTRRISMFFEGCLSSIFETIPFF